MKRLLMLAFFFLIGPVTALAQSLVITIPARDGYNPIQVPPVTTYRWQTASGQTDPAEVRWILEPLSNHNDSWQETIQFITDNPQAPGWYPWQTYDPPDVGTYWTTPWTEGGLYVFAVQLRIFPPGGGFSPILTPARRAVDVDQEPPG